LLDVEKFKHDYEVINSTIKLNEVYFTGGEPTLYWDRIKECMKVIKQPVLINTMGLFLERIDEPCSISLSRHHWDHEINEEILGIKLPKDYLTKFPMDWRDGSNVTTNVIKGYVDTPEKMRKMMDFAMDNGFPLSGFVGLMPATQYAKEHRLLIPTMEGDDIMTYRENKYNKGTCMCSNLLYNRNGELHRFYVKQNFCPTENRGGRIFYRNGIQPWFKQTLAQQEAST
jgi:molybdenum cofactor biosynthesis enzyme MoaA